MVQGLNLLMKSGADDAVAEEIIQETMTIIWTKADYYDPSGLQQAPGFILLVTKNDILRKTRKAVLEDIETAILPC